MTLDKERFIRFEEVQHRVGLSRTTLKRYENEGIFPKRIYLNSRHVVWIESAVEEWINEKLRLRDSLS